MTNCHICGEKIKQTESQGVEIDEKTGEEKPYHFHCLFPDDPTICGECGQKIENIEDIKALNHYEDS